MRSIHTYPLCLHPCLYRLRFPSLYLWFYFRRRRAHQWYSTKHCVVVTKEIWMNDFRVEYANTYLDMYDVFFSLFSVFRRFLFIIFLMWNMKLGSALSITWNFIIWAYIYSDGTHRHTHSHKRVYINAYLYICVYVKR